MKSPELHWATSYAITADTLFTRFPYYKYIDNYKDIGGSEENKLLCARVFRYFFRLVLQDIIENQTMLKFPPGSNSWLEMTAVTNDEFTKARQNGAFQDIDFLASGFTGYNLQIRFQNRYGKWCKKLYVSSLYRDRIIRYTNQGKLLTSTKIREVKHYVDKVQEQFPIFAKSEINRICTFGLKRFAYVNRHHCDVLLLNLIEENVTAFCGRLPMDSAKFWQLWYVKWRMKERMIFHLLKRKWDGYYYIGLSEEAHQKILKQHGKKKHFEKFYLTKIKKEIYHSRWADHIWRVPYPIDCGWKFWREEMTTDKAEYVEPNQYPKVHKYYKQKEPYVGNI